ncbi:MAG: hypothetical protein WC564_00060 [Patescibacteria group bacterium]
MKKNVICLLTAIILLCSYGTIEAQNAKKALGDKPGLGSDYFIMVDTIFHFSPDLNVQGKIYYKEYSQRYKIKQENQETFFLVKSINFACDTFVLSMHKTMGDTIPGGLSAIKISSDNRWHTMYGETQIFGDSTEIKELGGSGAKDGFFYVYFCPTEQPCFSLRVKVKEKDTLLAEIKNLYLLYNQVGAGIYNKLPQKN